MNIYKMKDLCRIIFFLSVHKPVFSPTEPMSFYFHSLHVTLSLFCSFVLFFESWNHVSFFVAWCHSTVHFPEPDTS